MGEDGLRPASGVFSGCLFAILVWVAIGMAAVVAFRLLGG